MRYAVFSGRGSGSPKDDMEVTFVAVNILWQIVLGGGVIFYLGFLRQINLSELFGFRRLRAAKVMQWAAVGVILVAYPFAMLMTKLSQLGLENLGIRLAPQDPVQMFAEHGDGVFQFLLATSAIVFAPFAEEFIFRGLVYGVVKRFSDRFFATLFSALVFALVHHHLGSLLPLCAFGIILAVAYELTGCLWVPVAMHSIFNAITVAMILSGVVEVS